jgi:hypothetical protein
MAIKAHTKMEASEARSSARTLSKSSGEGGRPNRSGDDVSRRVRAREAAPAVVPAAIRALFPAPRDDRPPN